MALQNSWVTYLDRSYKSIKTSILNRMKVLVPEMTDLSESNLFVIIISIFAGLVEQLNYYLDNIARELYIKTARRYSSLISITRLIDYRVKAKVAATSDILVTAVDSSGEPVTLVNNFTFNANLVVKNSSGIQFLTTKKRTMLANTSTIIIGVKQSIIISNQIIGNTDSSPSQTYQLSDDYEDGTLQIEIDSETWELRDTLAFSGPLDNHFIVDVNENKEAWVVFGDGNNGRIPPVSQSIYATFNETLGSTGNLDVGTITIWDSSPIPPTQVPAISEFIITNPLAAAGGSNEEGIDDIRYRAPLSIRTLDRAVTKQDYRDMAELVAGVGKASAKVDTYSKTIIIYITPSEGGIASSALIDNVKSTFEYKGVFGPVINVEAAGETVLRISMEVMAKFRRDVTDTYNDIVEALITTFGYNNSYVNRKIRTSDIIALVDNLDKVDYLTLSLLTTKPYPRAIAHTTPLESNWYITVTESNTQVIKWRLVVSGSNFVLFKSVAGGSEAYDSTFAIQSLDPGAPSNTSSNGEILISVYGTLTTGLEWFFYTYPYNKDIELEDYTMPIIDVDELDIVVNKQIIAN